MPENAAATLFGQQHGIVATWHVNNAVHQRNFDRYRIRSLLLRQWDNVGQTCLYNYFNLYGYEMRFAE